MPRVTSPMGGRRRQKLSDRERALLRKQELGRQRAHEVGGRAEAEKTKRMGILAGAGAEAARRGGRPEEVMGILSGRPSPAAGAGAGVQRPTTRQRYVQKTYGPEGVAKAKKVRAMHAGLRETDLRMARTRTRADVEAERRMYAGYKKSPGGDIYHKGEMVMPRRPKLSGIRGMQYLAKPSPEQQTRADQASAGLAGGKPGMTPQDFIERGYAPRPGETPPQQEGRRQEAWEGRFTRQEPEIARASLVQSLDNLSTQLQTATDPAQVAALIQQFDETAQQYEATTPMLAGQGPPAQAPAAPSGRFDIPGYAPGEVPPIGYRPPAAVSGDFRMMGPTRGELAAAPLTAPPPTPGGEELRLRAAAAPLQQPLPAPAAGGPAGVSPFGGRTEAERLADETAKVNLDAQQARLATFKRQEGIGPGGEVSPVSPEEEKVSAATEAKALPVIDTNTHHLWSQAGEVFLRLRQLRADLSPSGQRALAAEVRGLEWYNAMLKDQTAMRRPGTFSTWGRTRIWWGRKEEVKGWLENIELITREVDALSRAQSLAPGQKAGELLPSGRTPPGPRG